MKIDLDNVFISTFLMLYFKAKDGPAQAIFGSIISYNTSSVSPDKKNL